MVHEESPTRLARILHDHISGQTAIALRNLELFELYHEEDPDRARRRAQTAHEVLKDLMTTLGAVLLAIDGPECDSQPDLGEALRSVATAFDPGGTQVEVLVAGDQARLAPAVRAELLVVLREGLLNALRHAAAARIRVDVSIGADQVRAEVSDDGVGIGENLEHRHGLRSMRYRAEALGGSLADHRRSGSGTALRLTVPLGPATAACCGTI